jgi:glycosyltransferase involved in cell wall biosynthesis
MRILLLSKFTEKAPGTRYRHTQYLPYLSELGVDVITSVFLSDAYLQRIYENKRKNYVNVIDAYLKRFIDLLRNRGGNDVLWIQFEALPFIPFWIEYFLIRDTPYVVEYDEPVFHNYDMHSSPLIRKLLGRKIDQLMNNAALVIAGNSYIAERAYKAGAKKVEIIPTVIDLEKYSVKDHSNTQNKFIIGWIGSFSTSSYLNQLINVTRKYTDINNTTMVAIGASKELLLDENIQVKKWVEETEVEEIKEFDIGIMPLSDSPWSKGKSGFKLIQYMACGLPVIASPVGTNADIVEHGVNGFLANNDDEWIRAIETLKNQPDLRRAMGNEGRKKVESMYCLQVTAPKLKHLLSEVARST